MVSLHLVLPEIGELSFAVAIRRAVGGTVGVHVFGIGVVSAPARGTLAKIEGGEHATTTVPYHVILKDIDELRRAQSEAEIARRRAELADVVKAEGSIRAAAKKLGMDASNLRKTLRNGNPKLAPRRGETRR
jgi:hypothetical protein